MNCRTMAAAFIAALLSAVSAHAAETLDQAWSMALTANAQLAAVELESAAAQSDVGAAVARRFPDGWVGGGYAVRSDERSFEIENPLAPGQSFIAPYAQQNAANAAAGVTM